MKIPYLSVAFDTERVDHVCKNPKSVSGSKDIQNDQVWKKMRPCCATPRLQRSGHQFFESPLLTKTPCPIYKTEQ